MFNDTPPNVITIKNVPSPQPSHKNIYILLYRKAKKAKSLVLITGSVGTSVGSSNTLLKVLVDQHQKKVAALLKGHQQKQQQQLQRNGRKCTEVKKTFHSSMETVLGRCTQT